MDFGAHWLLAPLQILLVDLLLGADNALVIGLACRSLPREDRRSAVMIGVAGAIALRLALTIVASSLLALPVVKLCGAAALILIAINLAAVRPGEDEVQVRAAQSSKLWAAAGVIIVADAAMSLDNVLALAAIARGDVWLLAIGVALSLPVIGYGGVLLAGALQSAPGLVAFGAALLGWVAGGMAVSDPLLSSWAETQAPGLVALAPALGAAFVFLQSRFSSPDRSPKRPAALNALVEPVAPPRPLPALAWTAEPVAVVEPIQPRRREDRVAIAGVLLLAVVAGAIILIASYLDIAN